MIIICYYSFIFDCWVFVAVLLHCFSLVVVNRGYSVAAVCRLLVAVASLVAEHTL